MVYVNEYCAVCNGVDNFAPWSYILSCRTELFTIIEDNPSFTLTLQLIQDYCWPSTFKPPTGLSDGAPARECFPHISSCLPQDELAALNMTHWLNQERYNELVQNCTQGPFNLVIVLRGLAYRNQYCAMCNGIHPAALNCYRQYTVIDFSLVLDIHRDGINVHSDIIDTTYTVPITCPCDGIFDPFSNGCRPSVCPEGYNLNGGVCRFRNVTTRCPDGFLPIEPALDCGSCAKSKENCSFVIPDYITQDIFCRCDADCAVYGDCCMDRPTCQEPVTSTADSTQGPVFQCRSINLDSSRVPTNSSSSYTPVSGEAFWMASECPEDWLTRESSTKEAAFIERNCTHGSSSLPPVTDRDTGVVYVNEYCAVCNGGDNIVPWSYSLICKSELLAISPIAPGVNATFDNDPGLKATLGDNPELNVTLNLIQEYCTPSTFKPPTGPSDGAPASLRECFLHISSCLPQDELAALNTTDRLNQERYNGLVHYCTQGPYSLVTESWDSRRLPYRNLYCAMCNGIDPTTVNCYEPGNTSGPVNVGFSMVLDIHRDGINVRSDIITTTVSVTCPSGEIFDPVSSGCRPSVCPEGYTLNGGVCSFRNAPTSTTEAFSYPDGLRPAELNDTDYTELGNDGCPEGLLPAELNDTDYTELGNDTVLLNGEVYDVIDYLGGNPVVCLSQNGSFLENTTVLYYSYPTGYFILTNIGCSLSVVGSFLILLTHILFKELRTLPSKILMNLAVAIIVSNLFILIGGPIISSFPGKNLCTSVAIILHMFFLAQFSWMSVMVFEMIRTLRNATKLTPESQHFKTRLFVAYFVLGWSIPLVITVASIVVNFTTDDLVLYGELEDGTQGSCWINHLESAIVAFIVPVALSILFNGVSFVCVSVLLCSAWRTQSKLDNEKHMPFFRVYIAIFSITGLTWLFGFLAILARSVWAWYLFIILNSTQGFVIFIMFLFTKKVALLYLELLHIPWKPKTSSTSAKKTYDLHTPKNGGGSTSSKTDSATCQFAASTDSTV